MTSNDLDARAINTIRALAMDLPAQAHSGHQGTAMALAPLAHVLWTRIMTYDADAPDWFDRDRFVLSAGHASVLLYAMLHLTGYDLSLDDLRSFRQWGSRTPGHPERGHTAGVEVTTGPLGQGVGNGVGLGIAEAHLGARFSPELCDHHTFVICGDGDLSEGVSHEAASLAGHLGLGRLVYIYDDNHITIDGPTEIALSDDAAARFRAYGWHVVELGEAANDLDALEAGIRAAMAVEDRPSLVVVRTHIGYPSEKFTDSPKAHGNPFDAAEIAATKTVMGMDPDQTFHIADDVAELYRAAGRRGREARLAWEQRLAAWTGDRAAFDAAVGATGVEGWAKALPSWEVGDSVATRVASGACFAALTETVPGLLGGGADLSSNTGTLLPGATPFSAAEPAGRQLYFGVREHGMGAILNGLAAHGGTLPVGGTFFVFSDYLRPAVRLAALAGHKVIYSFTHDSVGVGEDGPTHQPVEHLASLRAMPGLRVVRPADANETAAAWRQAVETDGPTALVLSRQNLPVLAGTADAPVERGAYVLAEVGTAEGDLPDVALVGTGSEVSVCLAAADLLAADGLGVRVVSMPCWEDFDLQDELYQAEVLPAAVPTVAVEAGASFGWDRWADETVGIDRFGTSAPGAVALEGLGINAEHVAVTARDLLQAVEEA
jgi:transketolase